MNNPILQAALRDAPKWPEEGTPPLVPFRWNYTAEALMSERALLTEIYRLSLLIENPRDVDGNPTNTGMRLRWHEMFVATTSDRLWHSHQLRNMNWKASVIEENLHTRPGVDATPDVMAAWYASMQRLYVRKLAFLPQSYQVLLQMEVLCSKLKYETLVLVKSCTSYEQFEQSMLLEDKPQPTCRDCGSFGLCECARVD